MRNATIDTITSQIPQHVVEQYPNFVEFLQSYYAWLNEEGNPYERIKNHMDYVSFKKSLDDYTNCMFNEYLAGIPNDAKGSRETLIEWSKNLNLSRGSHDSYKFLFKVLFDDHGAEIYLPKDNILRASDGVWVANHSTILVTNPGDTDRLLYRRIYQTRDGETDIAEATVESIRISYSGRFSIANLTVVDVMGDFAPDLPILVTGIDDISVWPIKTLTDFTIEDGGENYFTNETLTFEYVDDRYIHEDDVYEDGIFDTRITTLFTPSEVEVYVDGNQITEFGYDGQYVTGENITISSTVKFIINGVYQGIVKIGDVSNTGSVQTLIMDSPPIAVSGDNLLVKYNDGSLQHSILVGLGTGLLAYVHTGVVRKIPGYYANNRGWLSSNMYLQDNDYYQEYSYEIRTVQEFTKYAEIIKRVLHPSGFKMFGQVRIYSLMEAIIGVADDGSTTQTIQMSFLYSISKYVAGSNLLWAAKNGVMSKRVYPDEFFDTDQINGDVDYALEDKSLERTFDFDKNPIVINKNGWMTKCAFNDSDIRIPQDYFVEDPIMIGYTESGYTSESDYDENGFINTYIETYMLFDYADTGYSE